MQSHVAALQGSLKNHTSTRNYSQLHQNIASLGSNFSTAYESVGTGGSRRAGSVSRWNRSDPKGGAPSAESAAQAVISSAALEKTKLLELCCGDVVRKFCERENGLEALRDTMQRELRELR